MCLSDLCSFELSTALLFPKRVRLSNKNKDRLWSNGIFMSFCTGFFLKGRKCNRCSASKFLLQLLQLLSTSSFQCSTGRNRGRQGLLTRPTAAVTASKSTTGGTDATADQVHTSLSEFHMTLQSPFPLRIFLRSCGHVLHKCRHEHMTSRFRQNLATLSLAPLICCTVGVSCGPRYTFHQNSHK